MKSPANLANLANVANLAIWGGSLLAELESTLIDVQGSDSVLQRRRRDLELRGGP